MARSRTATAHSRLTPSAERVLGDLAASAGMQRRNAESRTGEIEELVRTDLVARGRDGGLDVTAAGRSHLARRLAERSGDELGPYRVQHLDLVPAEGAPAEDGGVRFNAAESPLVWLARRKGRDGQALISPGQLQAGERLRADFTRAQMMPRVTSSWSASIGRSRRSGSAPANASDAIIAARQRVRHAIEAAGPEFSDLLLDVCCFLKGLDDVEQERRWPARSAKVVLQLGLDRLARHYGFDAVARGPSRSPLRAWSAAEAAET